MAHSVFHTGYQIVLNLSLDDLDCPERPELWTELHRKCRPGLLLCMECLEADPGCPQWMYVQMRNGVRIACHYNGSIKHASKPEGNRHRALKERIVTVAGKAGFSADTEVRTADQKRQTDVVVLGENNVRLGFEIQFSHATAQSVKQRTADARRVGLMPAWTTDTTTAPLIDRAPWTRIDRQPWENLRRPSNPLLVRGGIRQLWLEQCHQSRLLCPRRWGGYCDGWHGTWKPLGIQYDQFVVRAASQELVSLHLPALGDDRKRDAHIWTSPSDRQRYIDSGGQVVPDQTDVPAEQAASVAPKEIDPACRWRERRDYVPPKATHRDTGAVFGSATSPGPRPGVAAAPRVPEQRSAASAWPRTETGPCARCRKPTHRYGSGGNPLCSACQAG